MIVIVFHSFSLWNDHKTCYNLISNFSNCYNWHVSKSCSELVNFVFIDIQNPDLLILITTMGALLIWGSMLDLFISVIPVCYNWLSKKNEINLQINKRSKLGIDHYIHNIQEFPLQTTFSKWKEWGGIHSIIFCLQL